MNGAFSHPLRAGFRLSWLAAELVWIAINYLTRVGCSRAGRSGSDRQEAALSAVGTSSTPNVGRSHAQARWLQWGCRRVLRIFKLDIQARGPIPRTGLLVSNHLSYLDILILSALTPAVFVAKREVKNWPVFGWFAKLAGTVFVDRRRRSQVGASATLIKALLSEDALVVLFPEGTSSDGQNVLPFKSALLEPVASSRHPVSASAIEYYLKDGDVGEEVCYWKDMTLFPHLINLLSKRMLWATVQFTGLNECRTNRKQLAQQLRSEVLRLQHPRKLNAFGSSSSEEEAGTEPLASGKTILFLAEALPDQSQNLSSAP
jgi:1-acyl-sn-glycerol-3-phosphate acyltransferase